MDNYFKTNINSLISSIPALDGLSGKLSGKISVEAAKTGTPTVKYDNLLIHSAYDPEKEARAFAEKVPAGAKVCLYGFGLGYHIRPLLDKIGPEGSLLVIELNIDLLSAAMTLRDQTWLANEKRFHLIFGTEEAEVAGKISQQMKRLSADPEKLQVLFHSPSFKNIPENFPNIVNALEILLMERRFPVVLGDLEGENYSFNKDIVEQSQGIAHLQNKYKDKPAVLVSAGPSLDDILPYLRQIQGQTLLTCVDTALPTLSQEGILPEYVFSLDPQEASFSHFLENLENPINLIYTPTANAKMVRMHKGNKIVVFKENHPLFKDHQDLFNEKGTTQAGGSVSCLGLDCLIQMGCGPIILVGQDCAFSGNRTYSRNTRNDETFVEGVSQAVTHSQSHVETARQKKQVTVEGYDGKKIVTNQVMYSYLRGIEQITKAHPKTRVYNLCSHGAQIENVKPLGSINELMTILR